MEENQNPIIEMTDAEGNTVNAELYDIFEFENQKYALLVPVMDEDDEETEEMPPIAVMRLIEDGDNYAIEEIGSDEEWERVQNYLNTPCNCGNDCGEKKEGCCGGGNHNCGCNN